MIVGELVERLNNGDKMPDIAQELGVSKDTVSRRLKGIGFKYDNSAKVYNYVGEGEPPLEMDVNQMLASVAPRQKSEPKQTKIRPLSDENQIEVIDQAERDQTIIKPKSEPKKEAVSQKSEPFPFTDQEVQALKYMAGQLETEQKFLLFFEMSRLPSGEKTKKSIEISEETYNQFEEYAKALPKISKNELIEIALRELIRKYR